MTTASWVNLFQSVGAISAGLTTVSFIGLWISTSRLDKEKDAKIKEVEDAAKSARATAQPVTHLSASVHIQGNGKRQGYSERRNSGGHVAGLLFGKSGIMTKTRGPWMMVMVSDKVDLWGNDQTCDYYLDFRVDPIFPHPQESVEEFLRSVDMFSLQPWFLDLNTEIKGGTITLIVNSVVRREFPILPGSTGDGAQILGGKASPPKVEPEPPGTAPPTAESEPIEAASPKREAESVETTPPREPDPVETSPKAPEKKLP